MRRILFFLPILILLVACRAIVSAPTATIPSPPDSPTIPPPPLFTVTRLPSISPTAEVATVTPPAPPTFSMTPAKPTVTITASPTADFSTPPFTIRLHPDGGQYVGDLVSIEVIAPLEISLDHSTVDVTLDAGQITLIGSAPFDPFGIGGRSQATLYWAWDTAALEPGDYTLTFTVQPEEYVFTESVALLPQSQLPAPEPDAQWATVSTQYCVLHYITGTAAERDIELLQQRTDEQARDAVQRMGVQFTDPITITFVPRLLGHGGFAGQEINVSYLDRNYAGAQSDNVMHHEMIHILDGRLGGDMRPTMLVEGVAVYQTGGHFKPEPLMERAAALLDTSDGLGRYLPLIPLADSFYPSQHEIGYLEAGALVEYMVERWGWNDFSAFYRDIHPSSSQSAAIDAALQEHFGISFTDLERDFLVVLQEMDVDPMWREDVRLTVLFFDTVRRYQQVLDPSAYFQTAWLLDGPTMRQRGIVADELRHPIAPENLALETMLVEASYQYSSGHYEEADVLIKAVNATLDAIQQGLPQPFTVSSLANDYAEIVAILLLQGYMPQHIVVDGNLATAWVTLEMPDLIELQLEHGQDGHWIVK